MSTFWLCLCAFVQFSWTLPMYSEKTHGHSPEHNKIGRAVEPNNFIKKHRPDQMESILQKLGADRWSKGQDILKYHRSQCNHMNQSWIQWQGSTYNEDLGSEYTLKIFTGPLKPTFPQRNLFQYMSRIYKCCRLGFSCRRIKGLQGTLDEGGRAATFYIDLDILSLSIQRAQIHLEVSADEQLTVIPVLNINGLRRSSFTQIRSGHVLDLTLDVMSILQALKEKETVDAEKEEVTELSLSLQCIQNDLHVPCNLHRAFLLQSPFITLQYK
ncbi:uncharacterized protein LOC122933828 [Bufo gargarizans]|uniref:uncharacterized protein LOC122933828 n=1 Tax=Bufo gargarizans TaxID=30331 RepID=UPI001CF1F5F3|nr:uncharacterized protein LOC122933828 [Bufo gargarizans]